MGSPLYLLTNYPFESFQDAGFLGDDLRYHLLPPAAREVCFAHLMFDLRANPYRWLFRNSARPTE